MVAPRELSDRATPHPQHAPPSPHRSTSSTNMPYNTRRKSLSLAELGIIPKRSRAPSHPILPTTVASEEPPAKKPRRTSHVTSDSPLTIPQHGMMSPPRTTTIRTKEQRPKPSAQLSPPPSPLRDGEQHKIDTEGISDDIVIGVIEQLEKTGNRPHLVKELAAILASSVPAVEKSANPSALISSRLTTYLGRARPTFSPCPIAKLIEPVHPRRLYFYLTTMPQRPLPTAAEIYQQINRITPSLSSHDDEDEEEMEADRNGELEYHQRSRMELSPSPEVDLSSPELDDRDQSAPASPSRSFPSHLASQDRHQSPKNLLHNRRAASPQLEPEERTFKQTANQLYEQAQLRQNSLKDVDMDTQDTIEGASQDESIALSVELPDTEESAARKNREAAAELFAHAEHLHLPNTTIEFSSPMMAPQMHIDAEDSQQESMKHDEVMEHMNLDLDTKDTSTDNFSWDTLQSPENIELAELDDMFDAY